MKLAAWGLTVLGLAACLACGGAPPSRPSGATRKAVDYVVPPPAPSPPVPDARPVAPPPPLPAAAVQAPEIQRKAYDESRHKSVLELQQWRATRSVGFVTAAGGEGVATLTDLNPAVGAWWVLRLERVGGGDPEAYHLQNPFIDVQSLELDRETGNGLVLLRGGERFACDLWSAGPVGALAAARSSGLAYAPLCDGWLFLRNPTTGRRTSKEWAADFLRDRVWGGEKITARVRDTFFAGRFRREGQLSAGRSRAVRGAPGLPIAPRLTAGAADRRIAPDGLGLSLEREAGAPLDAGRWYRVVGSDGIFLSAVRPDLVAREIVERQAGRVNALEAREESALVYVVAFDVDRFDLGFALGTDHPRVGWSERVTAAMRDDSIPGPDGIGTVAPLARTGMLSPAEAVRVTATFTGGFKRSHGAFNAGALGATNHGSHYGFIEQGVVLSKHQPGLSTLAVYRDGRVFLGTWSTEMDADLRQIRYARQNGVPILERDPATGEARPGSLVRQWGAGNWSGSVDKKLRTLRAGACVQESDAGRFLLYGYFTSATPSGMARVFEAYGCRDAMLLDMNALEHTYLAVYREEDGRRRVEHLIDEMVVLDKKVDDQTVPRFVGFPDNRDFFFLLRRSEP